MFAMTAKLDLSIDGEQIPLSPPIVKGDLGGFARSEVCACTAEKFVHRPVVRACPVKSGSVFYDGPTHDIPGLKRIAGLVDLVQLIAPCYQLVQRELSLLVPS